MIVQTKIRTNMVMQVNNNLKLIESGQKAPANYQENTILDSNK